ncbi:MAG: hypothetical protein KDE27_23395 [Planctomycetes bacterium]|nr:hypothetical protein [Planctomycetota bacterium]
MFSATSRRGSAATCLVLLTAAVAVGQQPAAVDDTFRVPIHSEPSDAPGTAGIWAAGRDYKVSFHDGMTFYPVLGAGYDTNRPVRWQTRAVSVGGTPLLPPGAPVAAANGAYRFEYRHGDVVERYDVLPEGVEQSFVLTARPAATGDLVVEGDIVSDLAPALTAARDGALALRDANGTELVRYGRATALDASGRRLALDTALDGAAVRITVPASWLDEAVYPVTVDPLIASTLLSLGGSAATGAQIARDPIHGQQMVVFSRASSATDLDAFAILMHDDFGSRASVWSRLGSTSCLNVDVAFVFGPRKWVIVAQEDSPNPLSRRQDIRYHRHDADDFGFSSTTDGIALSFGEFATAPSVGGTSGAGGDACLITYQIDRGGFRVNTPASEIHGTIVDLRTNAHGPRLAIGEHITGEDNERPQVIPASNGGTDPWVVVFENVRPGVAGDDWDLFVRRVRTDGSSDLAVVGNSGNTAVHKQGASIAGERGSYLIAYAEAANNGPASGSSGPALFAQRLDWPANQANPTRGPIRGLRSGFDLTIGGIAYDRILQHMWAVVGRDRTTGVGFADRIGFDTRVAESVAVGGSSTIDTPGVAYDTDDNSYALVFGAANALLAARLVYPSLALPLVYGTGCGPATLTAPSNHAFRAWAGSDRFGVRISNAPTNALTFLFVGLARAQNPLDAFGMTGCVGNLDLGALLFTTTFAVAGNTSRFDLPLPSALPGALGTKLLFQAVYQSPNSNSAGLAATRGLEVEVR